MIKEEHRQLIKDMMGIEQRECPKCGKKPMVMRLLGREWYCQKCADKVVNDILERSDVT